MAKEYKYRKSPTFIFRMRNLDGNEKLMLMTLIDLGNKSCNYNQEQLGKLIGVGRDTSANILQRLSKKGMLRIIKGHYDINERTKTNNTYEVIWSELDKYAVEKDYFYVEEQEDDITLQQEEETLSEVKEMPENEVLETDFRYKELDMSIFDELRETELPIEEKDKQPTASWVDELREIKFNTPAFYKKMNDIIKTYPSAMHDEMSSKIYNYFKKTS